MHPDDESLAAYADDPEGARNAKEIVGHLETCSECSEFVRSIREVDSLLADGEAWAYADEMRLEDSAPDELLQILRARVAEDLEARQLLDKLLRNPFSFVWTDLAGKPRFRTAGVVRRLCEEVLTAAKEDPPHARDLADTAMLILETLDPKRYSTDEVTDLRGLAWKARAIARRALGELKPALEALDRAEDEFGRLSPGAAGIADVAYFRADILSAMGQLDEATRFAQDAARSFEAQGRTSRYIQAKLLSGVIAYRRSDFASARDVFLPLLEQAEADGDLALAASLSQNLGTVYVELGQSALAVRYLLAATAGWAELGRATESARSEWSLAQLLMVDGAFDAAADRLANVQAQFGKLKAADDAALVRLLRVEALLLAQRPKEAAAVCKGLAEELMDLGIKPAAYKALAYIQQLAAAGTLSAQAVRIAGKFLRDLREDPTITFLPPS
jgi:tetratricopeptide (TPR) repeat protein